QNWWGAMEKIGEKLGWPPGRNAIDTHFVIDADLANGGPNKNERERSRSRSSKSLYDTGIFGVYKEIPRGIPHDSVAAFLCLMLSVPVVINRNNSDQNRGRPSSNRTGCAEVNIPPG